MSLFVVTHGNQGVSSLKCLDCRTELWGRITKNEVNFVRTPIGRVLGTYVDLGVSASVIVRSGSAVVHRASSWLAASSQL
jgi:hypothetical protein